MVDQRKTPMGYLTKAEAPHYCYNCEAEATIEHWYKRTKKSARLGFYWQCKPMHQEQKRQQYYDRALTKDPAFWDKVAERQQAKLDRHPLYSRARNLWRSYKKFDLNNGHSNTIEFEDAFALMLLPCFYCESTEQIGIDRFDNNQGHSLFNSNPCCYNCNHILGDLPSAAKQIMKASLLEIRITNALGDWVPQTLRSRKVAKI